MTEKSVYGNLPSDTILAIEYRKLNLDSGLLGGLFGSKGTAPTNIAGSSIFLLLFLGGLVIFFPNNTKADELWKTIMPVITMILGYLFGKTPDK